MGFSKGDRVNWTLWDGSFGAGECVFDEDGGKVVVAIDPKIHPKDLPTPPGELPNVYPDEDYGPAEDFDVHRVIFCTATWLRPEPKAELAVAPGLERR